MLITCPACKAKYNFDEGRVGGEGIKLRCSKCATVFRIMRRKPPTPAVSPPEPADKASQRVRIVIANESVPFCTAVQKVLAAAPFDVFMFHDGREALDGIRTIRPDVVLLDVALPSMYGFEVCEEVKKGPETSGVKIILIASIYDKTRYKRSPQSLYGADDYIEKHHIPDSLVAMINRLVAAPQESELPVATGGAAGALPAEPESEPRTAPVEPTRQELQSEEATRKELQREEVRETSIPAVPCQSELPEAHVKARRLARIIVSDIVLYNQGKVEVGIRAGSFFDMLADDIREGRRLYEERIPEEIRSGTSYLEDAFQDLIARKKRELGL